MILQDDVNKWRFNVYSNALCHVYTVKTVHNIVVKLVVLRILTINLIVN